MIHRTRTLASAAALAALLTVPAATALASGDSGDGFNPAGADFQASSGTVTFKGSINGIPVTVTCTGSSFRGTTPSQPDTWSIILPSPPTLSGCTASSGQPLAFTEGGTWTVTWNDLTTGDTEPNTDQAVLKGTLTITFPGCAITLFSAGVTGLWDDVTPTTSSKFVFSNAPIAVTASGCTASGWTFTATYVTSPGITDT